MKLLKIFTVVTISLGLAACAADPNQLGLTSQQWQNMSAAEQQAALATYRQLKNEQTGDTSALQTDKLQIRLSQGEAMMPPFAKASPFQPVQFEVVAGQCKNVTLESVSNQHQVTLTVCYKNKRLYLDPSHYQAQYITGTVELHQSPIWLRGFDYSHIDSFGYARLANVNLNVKLIAADKSKNNNIKTIN